MFSKSKAQKQAQGNFQSCQSREIEYVEYAQRALSPEEIEEAYEAQLQNIAEKVAASSRTRQSIYAKNTSLNPRGYYISAEKFTNAPRVIQEARNTTPRYNSVRVPVRSIPAGVTFAVSGVEAHLRCIRLEEQGSSEGIRTEIIRGGKAAAHEALSKLATAICCDGCPFAAKTSVEAEVMRKELTIARTETVEARLALDVARKEIAQIETHYG